MAQSTKRIVIVAVVIAFIVAGAWLSHGRRQPAPGEPATPPAPPTAPAPELPAAGHDLAEGDKAPDFTLPDAGGQDFSLSRYMGKHNVLLFFHMGTG